MKITFSLKNQKYIANTEKMIAIWNSSQYGAQNDGKFLDMWGVIQDEVENGWFVPLKSEWSAFGSTFGIIQSSYGLSVLYWSSTQSDARYVYLADFDLCDINRYAVNDYWYVRLATIF